MNWLKESHKTLCTGFAQNKWQNIYLTDNKFPENKRSEWNLNNSFIGEKSS